MVESTGASPSNQDPFKPDRFGGIEVSDMALLPETEEQFDAFLTEKVPAWKNAGVRSL